MKQPKTLLPSSSIWFVVSKIVNEALLHLTHSLKPNCMLENSILLSVAFQSIEKRHLINFTECGEQSNTPIVILIAGFSILPFK